MSARSWVVSHRRLTITVLTLCLGLGLPLPGYVIAGMFWPGGLHDLSSNIDMALFIGCVVGVSLFAWGWLVNALTPHS